MVSAEEIWFFRDRRAESYNRVVWGNNCVCHGRLNRRRCLLILKVLCKYTKYL